MDGTIICLGDSLTWGFPYGPEVSWVNLIPELYGYNAINRGINGNTTGDMLERLQRHVIAKQPEYTIITGGANDVFWRESVDAIVDNYRKMITTAEDHGIKVIIGLTPPIDEPEMEARLKRLRTDLIKLAREKSRLVIDFSTPFYRDDGTVNGELFLDGAHPTREGYQLMGKCLPAKLA